MEFLLDWMAGSFEIKTSGRDKAEEIIDKLEEVCPDLHRESWFDMDRKIMTYNKMLSWYGKGILYLAWREEDNKNRLHLCFTSQAIQVLGFETMQNIYNVLARENFRASRIDLALDVFDKNEIPLHEMLESFKRFSHYGEKTVVSKILRTNFKVSQASFWDGEARENWTIGGRTGHVYFRFYDKKMEQKLISKNIMEMIKDGRIKASDADYFEKRSKYWYRVEMELKHEHAQEAFRHMSDLNAIPGIFSAIMKTQIRFVKPQNDKNVGRYPICEWYVKFLELLESYYFVQFNPKQNLIKDLMKYMGWYYSLQKVISVGKAIAMGTLQYHTEDELGSFLEAMEDGRNQWKLKCAGLAYGFNLSTNEVYIYRTDPTGLSCPIPA